MEEVRVAVGGIKGEKVRVSEKVIVRVGGIQGEKVGVEVGGNGQNSSHDS